MTVDQQRFLDLVLQNPTNRAVLARGHELGVDDWWLTAGAVFQSVWNCLEGRDPAQGIRDYDVFYFDSGDQTWESEDVVIRDAQVLFSDIEASVEVRNEARVHLWYGAHFGVPAAPFISSRDAIDHFASTTCCYAVSCDASGRFEVYAPYGFADLFDQRVRPNPVLAPREVYENKTTRWAQEWRGLTVDPWPLAL